MSVTKEEAFKQYEEWRNLGFGHSTMPSSEVLVMAMDALRPITREQVEQVWMGCEYCAGDVNDRPYLDSKEIYIYDDGILMNGYESACKILFCPKCGRPLTDEAVDIFVKRMEEMRNG